MKNIINRLQSGGNYFIAVLLLVFFALVLIVGPVAIFLTHSYEHEFNKEYQQKIQDKNLLIGRTRVEEQAVSGLVKNVAFNFGACKGFMKSDDCHTWATSKVIMETAKTGNVDLARAKIRIMHELGLPIDAEYRSDLAASPDLGAAVAVLN